MKRIFLIIMLVFILGTSNAIPTSTYASDTQDINNQSELRDINLIWGDNSRIIRTTATTVSQALAEMGIVLDETDRILPDINSPVLQGMDVVITSGIEVFVNVNGIIETVKVPDGVFASSVISTLETRKGQPLHFPAQNDTIVTSGMQITAYPVFMLIQEETVPYEVRIVETEELFIGDEQVSQQGVLGQKIVTYESYIINGESIFEPIDEKVVLQPVEEIRLVGIKQPVPLNEHGFDYVYLEKLTMTATAYNSGSDSTGKKPGQKGYGLTYSGIPAGPGIVAVDPKVIPLGTKLYIEGYGYALAADIGGAIKGNKIDLYIEDAAEIRRFGRRQVVVYVLAQ